MYLAGFVASFKVGWGLPLGFNQASPLKSWLAGFKAVCRL